MSLPPTKETWTELDQLVRDLVDKSPAKKTDTDPETAQIESVYAKFKIDQDRRAHLAYTTPAAAGYQWSCEISLYNGPDWQHFLIYPDQTIRHAHGDDRDLTEINQAEAEDLLRQLKQLS